MLPPGHPLFWSVGARVALGHSGATNVSSLSVVQSPVGEVGDLLRDRHRVVGEPLVVAAGERRVDGLRGLTLPALAQHLLEHRDVQVVDLVVLVAQLFGDREILRAQQLGELARDLDVESPISVKVPLRPRGMARSGKRMRVSCAMCSAMSPMRSSDALIRRALTTMRRSRATGCWRARISIASSSSAMAFSSMTASASMTSSASETSLVPKARVAFSIAVVTSSEISTSRSWTSSSDWWKTSRIRHSSSRRHGSSRNLGDCRQGRLTNGAARVNSNRRTRSALRTASRHPLRASTLEAWNRRSSRCSP